MSIRYVCRHCGTSIGILNVATIDSKELGFDHLTATERKQFIHYNSNGEMSIQTICEDCQEALERNPDYHQYETFIQ
ncbi:anti-sigma-F factor Fin family protein [Bacillus sp. CGMCC 1.16541]|uniref:anti-sigma-F factor Fin family protein n=1 Tax=Bacillus sp. CGMCC 1.16541 TaxID=2185143 RepID=UPI000D737A13|nr:anti-sigma-F factor Fin family protein [Bacillus sp. CGMCC 1.16541]